MELCDLSLRNFVRGERPESLAECAGYFKDPCDDPEWPEMRIVFAIIQDITKAISFIHSFGLVHRDIKPENSNVYERLY
jgi:serine/threonine protein kinase